MNKIKEFIKNISPFNNRTDMPKLLYVIKVILIFWVFKFGAELVGEGIVLAIHFACGKNPLQGEMFGDITITLISGSCFKERLWQNWAWRDLHGAISQEPEQEHFFCLYQLLWQFLPAR